MCFFSAFFKYHGLLRTKLSKDALGKLKPLGESTPSIAESKISIQRLEQLWPMYRQLFGHSLDWGIELMGVRIARMVFYFCDHLKMYHVSRSVALEDVRLLNAATVAEFEFRKKSLTVSE